MERHIDIIIGRPTSGEDNSSGCKTYAQATIVKHLRTEGDLKITFKEEEMKFLDPNNNDTSVVSIRIINARMTRFMINTDNSTNVIYFDLF